MKLKPPRTRQLARSARVNEETMGSGFYHHFVLSFSFLDLRKAELDMAGRHERGEVEKGNTYSFFFYFSFLKSITEGRKQKWMRHLLSLQTEQAVGLERKCSFPSFLQASQLGLLFSSSPFNFLPFQPTIYLKRKHWNNRTRLPEDDARFSSSVEFLACMTGCSFDLFPSRYFYAQASLFFSFLKKILSVNFAPQ